MSVFDVTADDVANVSRPVAPMVAESAESNDPVVSGEKDTTGCQQEMPEVVEEDAEYQEVDVGELREKHDISARESLPGSFWPDEEETPEPKVQQDEDMDHFMNEGADVVEDGEEAPTAISLVSSLGKSSKKQKKPKFRSRKSKGK